MHSGLVMVQTTNGILNKTLYDQSTPKALLAWHRVRLANWLASSGEEWANYVSQYNSGTLELTTGSSTHIMLYHWSLQEPTTISTWYWT